MSRFFCFVLLGIHPRSHPTPIGMDVFLFCVLFALLRKKPAHTPIGRIVIDTLKKDGHARNLSDKEIADGRNFLDRVSRSAINGMAVVTSKKRPEDPISSLLYRKWFLDGKELKQRREEFPRWKDEKGRKLNLLLNVSVVFAA